MTSLKLPNISWFSRQVVTLLSANYSHSVEQKSIRKVLVFGQTVKSSYSTQL